MEKGTPLPEIGTRAAAVSAIESLIFRAIGAKDLEPVQLRYWLDAYYQARRAAEDDRAADSRPYEEAPHPSPSATPSTRGACSPQEEVIDRKEGDGAELSAPP